MNFTTEQIKYLISIQRDFTINSFIRSLKRVGILKTMSGWKKEKRRLVKDAVPAASLSTATVGDYFVYAQDQTEQETK